MEFNATFMKMEIPYQFMNANKQSIKLCTKLTQQSEEVTIFTTKYSRRLSSSLMYDDFNLNLIIHMTYNVAERDMRSSTVCMLASVKVLQHNLAARNTAVSSWVLSDKPGKWNYKLVLQTLQ